MEGLGSCNASKFSRIFRCGIRLDPLLTLTRQSSHSASGYVAELKLLLVLPSVLQTLVVALSPSM